MPLGISAVAVACCVDCVLACCVLAVNDSDWHSGGGSILPSYQPSVHGKVSLQSCARACHAAKLTIAGVNAGSDCLCGVSSDMQSAAARARNRPKSECMASACDADPGDKVSGRFPATHTHCISMAYLTVRETLAAGVWWARPPLGLSVQLQLVGKKGGSRPPSELANE